MVLTVTDRAAVRVCVSSAVLEGPLGYSEAYEIIEIAIRHSFDIKINWCSLDC